MSVKVRLGVGNSFAPVGNQEQFEAIQKQSGSNGGEGEDERTQLTGGDGDPQPHHLLCSPTVGLHSLEQGTVAGLPRYF